MNEQLLRKLPKMDTLLSHPALADSGLPYPAQKEAARAVLEDLRADIRAGRACAPPEADALAEAAARAARAATRPRLRRVVNATGVVLHTNLGRAPLSPGAAAAAYGAALGYSNLEYDLEEGGRGSRHRHVEGLLRRLTGAEGALAVNNNAAAVLLMLCALAPGRGVAVSRGELVEIGGGFRVPDILERGGARLVEVGTTNKTRPADYAAALDSGRAQAILKVHPSNFKVVGFTQDTPLSELAGLARARGLPLLYDLGSGALTRDGPWPADCPTAREAVEAGADVVCFSADKLLGGPQAGLAVGRREAVAAMAADPLARAVRIDKLSLAALEATLRAWTRPETARSALPVPAMLGADPEALRARAEALAGRLGACCGPRCACAVVARAGEAGGGTLPGHALPGWAVALTPAGPVEALERFLRGWDPPVLGCLRRGALLLDVRTLLAGDEDAVAGALAAYGGDGA